MRRVAAVFLLATAACTATTVDDSSFTVASGSTTSTSAATGWVEVAPMSIARSEHPGVVLNGEIVVSGGFIEIGVGRIGVTESVEAYSPETDTWRELPALPEPRHHGMAAGVADRLFVIGGYSAAGDAVDTVWVLVDDNWVDRAPLPGPVAAGAAVVVDDSIYVVGGTPEARFYRYDVASDAWAELPGPGLQREHVAAVAQDGEVWAIAGRWEGEIFNTTEIYDPGSESWRSGPTLNEARSGFGAVVIDGSVVVAGGEVFSPDEALDSVERLDSGTGEWSFIDPLPHGLHGNPLVVVGTDLYLPGGSTRAAGVENDGRSYRLTLG
jgi:N-acetylneuraminic acid mutarotase